MGDSMAKGIGIELKREIIDALDNLLSKIRKLHDEFLSEEEEETGEDLVIRDQGQEVEESFKDKLLEEGEIIDSWEPLEEINSPEQFREPWLDEICFTFANFSEKSFVKAKYTSFLKRHGAKVCDFNWDDTKPTHVVTQSMLKVPMLEDPLGVKITCSAATGKWILHPSYIEACIGKFRLRFLKNRDILYRRLFLLFQQYLLCD